MKNTPNISPAFLKQGDKIAITATARKVSKEEVVITVLSNNKSKATRQQMGIEVKEDIQGASTVILTYETATGILKTAAVTFRIKSKAPVKSTACALAM